MNTVCGSCFAHVSDRAKFCQVCGHPLSAEKLDHAPTNAQCPACVDHRLSSRGFEGYEFSILECQVCAGVWLDHQNFDVLKADAVKKETPDTGPPPEIVRSGSGPFVYRKCPQCTKLMNRQQFGQTSGIILDICPQDGIWFDAEELSSALRWISSGEFEKARVAAQKDHERNERDRAQFRALIDTLSESVESPFPTALERLRKKL
jgi:Zn-finger nucleic acid-binding protein